MESAGNFSGEKGKSFGKFRHMKIRSRSAGIKLLGRSWVSLLAIFVLIGKGRAANPPNIPAWPTGSSPQEIGLRVAEHFVATPHGNVGRFNTNASIIYPETCTWYGALT